MDKEILKGSIDILLLSLISQRDCYGYEMAKSLKENSSYVYNMSEGTLYPALKRLERKEWVISYWKEIDGGNRRKYYQITDDGKKQLQSKLKDWNLVQELIQKSSEGLT
ncbi:PadR family transcriptional regulator [Bacillus sp. JJ722]|uniref:PadR family transcriptional regulator n=1 Tax=Bacillus sp. JJ722 TaxID=3122973 RepID=UPI002FFD78FF